MLTAECLSTAVLDFSTEYNNSRQNIIILFCKYLVDNRSEALLILFWEYINGKLFKLQFLGRTLFSPLVFMTSIHEINPINRMRV